jgi:transcriptional regulator with XRE-family HTH domain
VADTIGGRVKHLRSLKNWTLQELFERSGVSKSYLSELENGKSSPTATVLQQIADAFNVPVTMFYENTDLVPIQNYESQLPDDVQAFLRSQKGVPYIQLAIKAAEFEISPVLLDQIINALRSAEKIEKGNK